MYSMQLEAVLLELADAALDDVTDADDAAEVTVLDDRDVSDAAFGHQVHDRLDAAVGCTPRRRST